MSKGQGRQIAIKFTEPLLGDVTNKVLASPIDWRNPLGFPSASNVYSSQIARLAFDASTGSYWGTRLTGEQWIQIKLSSRAQVRGFRWYIGGSHRPNEFIFEASNDGEIWSELLTTVSTNTTGWKEFLLEEISAEYLYFRWRITSRYSTYIYVYDIQLAYVLGNERAFRIIAQEPEYIDGPLISKEYIVDKVQRFENTLDTLLLTFHQLSTFQNVEGPITVEYDSTIGTLIGSGGAVESFSEFFTPDDLEPWMYKIAENFIVNANAQIDFIKVVYNYGYATEKFTATADCEIEFQYVGVVNP